MQTTIMIVEDNILISEMYRYKLELEGFQVLVRNDGLDALEKLKWSDPDPDLILLDLMMPGMNGFEVLERVRHMERLKNAKIIVFSNLSSDRDRDRCLELGADDFALKANITPKELVTKIKNALCVPEVITS